MADTPKIQPVLKNGLHLLELITQSRNGYGVSELSRKMNLSPSTIHNLLSSLKGLGLIEQNQNNKRYHVTPKVFSTIYRTNQGYRSYGKLFHAVRRLSEKTGYSLRIGELHDTMLYTLFVAGPGSDSLIQGSCAPAYLSSMGKALIAEKPKELWSHFLPTQAMLDQLAPWQREGWDEKHFFKELERAHANGYVWTLFKTFPDHASVATSIKASPDVQKLAVTIVIKKDDYLICDKQKLENDILELANKLAQL